MGFKHLFPSGWFEEKPPVSDEAPLEQSEEAGNTIKLSKPKVIREHAPRPTQADSEDSGNIDPEYAKFVEEFLEKENLPQIEYLEFGQAVHEVINSGVPVEQAFRTTFTALKPAGLTLDKLIQTNQHYSGKLNELDQSFVADADALVAAKAEEVKNAVAEMTARNIELEKEASKIRKRLSAIETEVGGNKTKLDIMNSEVAKEEETQSSRKIKMHTAIQHFLEVINEDLKHIQTYLGGNKK